MIKNFFLTALLFCGIALGANAQDGSVSVLYLDGSAHVVQMSQVATMKVSGGVVTLADQEGATVAEHKISDIDKIDLTSTATGVSQLGKQQSITIHSNGYTITAEGMTDGELLMVYTTDGRLVGKATARNGKATVDCSLLKAGTFVVKAQGQSLKMVKR